MGKDPQENPIVPEPEPVQAPSPEPAKVEPAPAAEPPQDKTDWKAKYDGLQGYARQQRTAAETWQAKFNGLSNEHEAAIADRDARIQDLEKQVQSLTSQTQELTGTKEKLEKHQAIGKKVRTEFPELSELFEEGLLRTEGLDGDDLEQYLSSLAEKLRGQLGNAVRQTLRGAVPPRPAGQRASQSVDELFDALYRLSPESPDYQKVLQEYEQAVRAEK